MASQNLIDPTAEEWTVQCDALCAGGATEAGVLNRSCFCIALEPDAMHDALDRIMDQRSVPPGFAGTHPHLFSALPVYLSRSHIEQISDIVRAVEVATGLQQYQDAVLAWAPDIARFDPGPAGGLLGLDFHLSPEGPRLIEINTNPGGLLLNLLAAKALRLCMPDTVQTPTDPAAAERKLMEAMLAEFEAQRHGQALSMVAIVDHAPELQYLYPEFQLFREMFLAHGVHADICDPGELEYRDGQVRLHDGTVDMVYNRLTDFALAESAHSHLKEAYLAGDVVVTPHPRAHALYADKRNLTLLGDAEFLERAGLDQEGAGLLGSAVPKTELLTSANWDALWKQRRHLFFKPADGYGSKASYRGDKLTRGVWAEFANRPYIAQQLVPPSERKMGEESAALKADIRCYAYRGTPLMYSARLYQGQTTNFRTPGGGFAPVLVATR